MKLLTKEVEKRLKKFPIKSQDGKGLDAEVVVKFFDPTGRYTFFVTDAQKEMVEVCPYEDDPLHKHEHNNNRCISEVEDWFLFGYALSPLGSDCDEFGGIMLSELQATKVRFGLGIERDLHLSPGRTIREELKVLGIDR